MKTLGEPDIRNINQILADVVFLHSSLSKTSTMTRAMKHGEKFQIKVVVCILQHHYISAEYCFLWHVDTIMRFQWDFSSTEDFEKHCLQIEKGHFDNSEEFAKVRNTFVTIIKMKSSRQLGFFTLVTAHTM
jgi:hypothetical protein